MKISKQYAGKLAEKLTALGSLKGIDDRCTGRTTGLALDALGRIMITPNTKLEVNQETATVLMKIVQKLELSHVRQLTSSTVIYEPYMSEDDVHRELLAAKD